MQASEHQQGILDWIAREQGHGIVQAVAGAGKSTTLKMVAQQLQGQGVSPNQVRVIVFGKANQRDLSSKFDPCWKSSISTLHSAGWGVCKAYFSLASSQDYKIQSWKFSNIAKNHGYINSRQDLGSLTRPGAKLIGGPDFLKLIDLVRLTLFEPTEATIAQLVNHYGLEMKRQAARTVANAVADCLAIGLKQSKKDHIFDFTDQIWLPVHMQMDVPNHQFVLVDECQDLNAAQLELAVHLAGDTGRVLAVGDKRQAIMGFAGADAHSFANIQRRLSAKELPLSTCYRCPKSHISMAQEIFPTMDIETWDQAQDGTIETVKEDCLESVVQPGDLILCRKTAPLVSTCISLISQGIKALVKGRSIGDSLKKEVDAIASIPSFVYANFLDMLSYYSSEKSKQFKDLDNGEELAEALADRLSAIRAVYEAHMECQTVEHLNAEIDRIFSDEEGGHVVLSTCHRAKGLEAERVFLLRPHDMPMTWKSQNDWQYEQEENLLYVALTRSKSHLFVVLKSSSREDQPSWWQTDYLTDRPKKELPSSSTAQQQELDLTESVQPILDLPEAISSAWLQDEILRELCRRKLQSMTDKQLERLLGTVRA